MESHNSVHQNDNVGKSVDVQDRVMLTTNTIKLYLQKNCYVLFEQQEAEQTVKLVH